MKEVYFKRVKNYLKNHSSIIIFLILLSFFFYFFSYSMTITYDGGHYMSYVDILKGEVSWSAWDIVRGPIFPILIYLGNLLFGETANGLLMISFIWYIFMLFFLYLQLKFVIGANSIRKNLLIIFLIFLTIFNPIVFGYYHSLLTEYIGISFGIFGCFLSIKFLELDWKTNKKRFLFFGCLITLLGVFAWFLKQPYISTILFPFFISIIIAIFEKKEKTNIVSKVISLIIFFISFFSSLTLWNSFLENKGVNLNSDRNVTKGLGTQLILAIDYFEIIEDERIYTEEYISSNKFLSKKETNLIKNIDSNQYVIVDVYNKQNSQIDSIVLQTKDDSITATYSLTTLFSSLFNKPVLILDSYMSNYMAIINMYATYTPDGVGYYVKKGVDLDFVNENATIAYRIFYNDDNTFYMPPENLERVLSFYQINNPPILLNIVMQKLSTAYIYIFKFNLLVLPFTLLGSIIYKILFNIKSKNRNLMNYTIILLGFSFLHIVVHVVTGSLIDRYAAPVIIPTMIGNILLVYLLYVIIRKRHENEKN